VLGALATLSLLVGILLLLASILRLGFIANFISEPILIGFKAGIGLVIILDQVPKLLGIHISKGSFIHNLVSILSSLPQTVIGYPGNRLNDDFAACGAKTLFAKSASSTNRGSRWYRSNGYFSFAGLWNSTC
jgi:hypothetical protein